MGAAHGICSRLDSLAAANTSRRRIGCRLRLRRPGATDGSHSGVVKSAFYPLPPCRVADTRKNNFPPARRLVDVRHRATHSDHISVLLLASENERFAQIVVGYIHNAASLASRSVGHDPCPHTTAMILVGQGIKPSLWIILGEYLVSSLGNIKVCQDFLHHCLITGISRSRQHSVIQRHHTSYQISVVHRYYYFTFTHNHSAVASRQCSRVNIPQKSRTRTEHNALKCL